MAENKFPMKWPSFFGPATLVAAAFIGPGTVTVCTIAGATHGYELLWALLFSVFATLVLQEMSARLGFTTRKGLGEAIRQHAPKGFIRILFIFIAISAVWIGNAAYEAGNIAGGVLGLDLAIGNWRGWSIFIGAIAGSFLYFGRYALLEKLLIGLVLLMSGSFLATALLLKPDLTAVFHGFIPSWETDIDFMTVMALVGTAVVPYNLFLHASTVIIRYNREASLRAIRTENAVSIGLGGVVSMAILIVAASAFFEKGTEIQSAAEMAIQLEPLLGHGSRYVVAVGLFAAGISSAITAPLAAAYAACGLFNWPVDFRDHRFRLAWGLVLACGMLFSTLGYNPVAVIQFAQVANGLILPIIAVFLLYLMNQKALLNNNTNTFFQNSMGMIVIGVTILISIRIWNQVWGVL